MISMSAFVCKLRCLTSRRWQQRQWLDVTVRCQLNFSNFFCFNLAAWYYITCCRSIFIDCVHEATAGLAPGKSLSNNSPPLGGARGEGQMSAGQWDLGGEGGIFRRNCVHLSVRCETRNTHFFLLFFHFGHFSGFLPFTNLTSAVSPQSLTVPLWNGNVATCLF